MTKDDAYNVIGVPRSASLKKTESIYQQKCHKLRFRILPGNTAAQRQRAQGQLVELTNAWNTVNTGSSGSNKKYKRRKTTAKPRATPRASSKPPQTMGDYWELFLSLTPFPRPVVVSVTVVVIVMAVILITQISEGA